MNELKQDRVNEIKTDIKKQFNEAIESINDAELFNFDEVIQSINEIKLDFVYDRNFKYRATMNSHTKTMTFNVDCEIDVRYTMFHELSHDVVYRADIQGDSGAHCLEFAIVNYCMIKKFITKENTKTTFLRSYDIHEDKSYELLCINVSQFDSIIRSVQWSTLKELALEAQRIARKIRRKFV